MSQTGEISKKERQRITKMYLSGELKFDCEIDPICECGDPEYPHFPHRNEIEVFEFHRKMRFNPEE
jgi:hypothetical protein